MSHWMSKPTVQVAPSLNLSRWILKWCILNLAWLFINLSFWSRIGETLTWHIFSTKLVFQEDQIDPPLQVCCIRNVIWTTLTFYSFSSEEIQPTSCVLRHSYINRQKDFWFLNLHILCFNTSFWFLNLPFWANFYCMTGLSQMQLIFAPYFLGT